MVRFALARLGAARFVVFVREVRFLVVEAAGRFRLRAALTRDSDTNFPLAVWYRPPDVL